MSTHSDDDQMIRIVQIFRLMHTTHVSDWSLWMRYTQSDHVSSDKSTLLAQVGCVCFNYIACAQAFTKVETQANKWNNLSCHT